MHHPNPARFIGASAALVLGAVAMSSQAAVIPVTNPGFEALVLADGTRSRIGPDDGTPGVVFTADPIPGWTVDPTGLIEAGTMNPAAGVFNGEAPGGQNVAYSAGTLIYQQVLASITPSTHYVLTVDVGRRTNWTLPFTYTVGLATITDSPNGSFMKALDHDSSVPSPGDFSTVTLSWDSPADVAPNTPLSIVLGSQNGPAFFDNVSLEDLGAVPFPEPATLSLVGVAIPLITRRRR